jgi:hypothetical protein
MKLSHFAALAVALFVGVAIAEDRPTAIKSGPQAGEKLAGAFHPLNVNGKEAGNKHCLYCENGANPVAMIFAREASADLTKLIKKIDAAVAKGENCGSFVVFCSSEDGLEAKLKRMAKEADLKKVVLSIDNPAGPEGYKVSKDAEITVILYKNRKCETNYAFAKGKMTDKDIDTIVEATGKLIK